MKNDEKPTQTNQIPESIYTHSFFPFVFLFSFRLENANAPDALDRAAFAPNAPPRNAIQEEKKPIFLHIF